jgi:hypothetical protein
VRACEPWSRLANIPARAAAANPRKPTTKRDRRPPPSGSLSSQAVAEEVGQHKLSLTDSRLGRRTRGDHSVVASCRPNDMAIQPDRDAACDQESHSREGTEHCSRHGSFLARPAPGAWLNQGCEARDSLLGHRPKDTKGLHDEDVDVLLPLTTERRRGHDTPCMKFTFRSMNLPFVGVVIRSLRW